MKTTLKFLTMALFAMMSTQVFAQNAQQNIDAAFNKFVDVLTKYSYITASSKENYGKGSVRWCNFSYPAKTNRMVEDYNLVLVQNANEADRLFTKKAGEKSSETMSVSYWTKFVQKTIQFGVHEDRNYNVVQLKSDNADNDSTMRCVYALIWRNENDSIKGTAYKIYDPIYKMTLINPGLQSDIIKFDGDTIYYKNGKKIPISVVPKDGVDFMSQLNNLRSSYNEDYRNHYDKIGSSIINRVLKLCKEHHSLLNADEREVGRTILTKWKKECYDDTRRELLNLSIKYIK